MFKKKTVAPTSTKVSDPIVCRITIYNKAYSMPHRIVNLKRSELFMKGSIIAKYPRDRYRVECL